MHRAKAYIIILILCAPSLCNDKYDLTLVSSIIKFANGLERLPIMIADLLIDDIKINHIPQQILDLSDVPERIKNSINSNTNNHVGSVGLLLDPLWYPNREFYKATPNSFIKLAYSMLEGTAIPQRWVSILNEHFDAVIVPDAWLVEVYTNSGVNIPIFVLPIGLYLSDFLSRPKHVKSDIFTFGLSAASVPGKNHEKVIDAFVQEFLTNPNEAQKVKLKIHSRGGDRIDKIAQYIGKTGQKNIEFIPRSLTQSEYIDFMTSIDCYVLLSMGEGFSITPREALSLGIPCILSNATAQKTLCKKSFITAVPADIRVPAYYSIFGETIGYKFDCHVSDARKAMRSVYSNYDVHLRKAQRAREWVKRYHYVNLKQKYLALVRPKDVILGEKNHLDDNVIITSSPKLYQKYKTLISRSAPDCNYSNLTFSA